MQGNESGIVVDPGDLHSADRAGENRHNIGRLPFPGKRDVEDVASLGLNVDAVQAQIRDVRHAHEVQLVEEGREQRRVGRHARLPTSRVHGVAILG